MNDEENVLDYIKRNLPIERCDHDFDDQLCDIADGILSTIGNDIGVTMIGPDVVITTDSTWSDILILDETNRGAKQWLANRVRLIFDPPMNSAILDSLNRTISEFEYRIANKDQHLRKEMK